jgi:hypothetical protein
MARFLDARKLFLVVALLVVSLVGCSSPATEPELKSYSGQRDSNAPAFSGPWADLFRSAYSAATTDLQRKILADEKITDQENNEVRTAFVSCMAGFSIQVELQERDSIKSQAPTGMADERYEEISKNCRAETSSQISGLYFQINRNPENKDEFAIMADCLSRSGLVEKGYSADDYQRDFSRQEFPFDESDPGYRACGLDPLNLEGTVP